ncbi:hypothetical protein M5K25_002841 [Dendrobium thyrsiflorum]|uniref:Uncharacterized protein n=1 Tax=Dendrobium thyrsiflorum TaxID=117978 RepID=A0ABD0VVP0_DENTH
MGGRSAKAELERISFAVSGWLDTMNRVSPTEKAMRRMASKERARAARETCAADPERARRFPVGPGIVERFRERAHARPPGEKKRAAMMMMEAASAGGSVGEIRVKTLEDESITKDGVFRQVRAI